MSEGTRARHLRALPIIGGPRDGQMCNVSDDCEVFMFPVVPLVQVAEFDPAECPDVASVANAPAVYRRKNLHTPNRIYEFLQYDGLSLDKVFELLFARYVEAAMDARLAEKYEQGFRDGFQRGWLTGEFVG